MNQQDTWREVDAYHERLLVGPDPRFAAVLEASHEAGLPPIQVTAPQGRFLELMARFQKARRILELGTLGGYSTAWLARSLPADGALLSLEIEPDYAAVARENLHRFDFPCALEIRVGDALAALEELAASGQPPFDLVFLDAEKTEYAAYLDGLLPLVRPGTMIIADNVVRDGEVINEESEDARVLGVREFNERVAAHPRLQATAVQTVGAKGYDGFTLICVE